MQKNRRRNEDRRKYNGTPGFPFKDSSGAAIRECRRKIPDRRIGSIQTEWIDEIVIDRGVTEP